MTSTTTFTQPVPARLADRRRMRESLAGVAGFAAITTAACIGMPAAAQAATADYASSATIDIHDRFYNSALSSSITVPSAGAATPYPAPITVTGIGGTVTDVDVTLNSVTHTFPDDLDVLLVGPNGQQAVLMSDTGGLDDLNAPGLVFDDEAESALPASSQITAGRYLPTNADGSGDAFPAPAPDASAAGSSLAVFDGADPNGEWRLYVVDDAGNDAGSIAGWRLSFDTTDGTQPYPATVQVAGASGTVTDVDVALHGLRHTFPDDLDLMLVGPGGQRSMIMGDAGRDADVTGLELVLDDEAAQPLPDETKLVSGTFRPADYDAEWDGPDRPFRAPAPSLDGIGSSLGAFDGTDPNGSWQLFVVDDEQSDNGAIDGGWSLHITTSDPVPPSPSTTPGPGGTPSTSPVPGGATSAGDSTHPKVSGHSPKSGATNVKRGALVTAGLSEKARRSTVSTATAKVLRKGSTKAVAATVRYDATARIVTIDPTTKLKAGTTYKVVVTTAVKDLAGNALDQKPTKTGLQKAMWTFTTR